MIPTCEHVASGVIYTAVFEATQKIQELAGLAGHPEDTQPVLNLLFGVGKGTLPMSDENIQDALLYTWEHWYSSDPRYPIGVETPMETYLNNYKK